MKTMREHVDEIQGKGSWDRMHTLINEMNLFEWNLPPVEVDGKLFHIFPGSNKEAKLDDVKNEIRRVLKHNWTGIRSQVDGLDS